MPASPFENFKQDFKLVTKQVTLATKIAKIKVEVATQKSEKERYLKTIGVKTYAIFCKDKTLDGKVVMDEISNELNLIQRIETHLDELQTEIANLQAQFRNDHGKDKDKDIVDATEIKEAGDEATPKS